jgi:hypothetical protein
VGLTAVNMKSSISFDVAPCSPLTVNQRFRGTSNLHFEGRRISLQPSSCCFLAWLILWHSRWRRHVAPKRLFTFNELHGFISHKTELLLALLLLFLLGNPYM